jgi:phosphoglycolate phosphatase
MYIFDLDGTLVDSSDGIIRAANRARVSFDYPSCDNEFLKTRIGLPVEALFIDLELALDIQDMLIKQFRILLKEEILREVKLFDGVTSLLDLLSAGSYELGIATSKSQELSDFTVKHSKLADYKFFVNGTGPARPKPYPDVILNCLSNYENASALMIGDRCEDVLAATASGIPAIGISQTSHSKKELLAHGAKIVFDRFDELIINFDKLEGIRSKGL